MVLVIMYLLYVVIMYFDKIFENFFMKLMGMGRVDIDVERNK